MSQASRQEVTAKWQSRYLKASREEKGRILDEFVAITGVHRKSAIRALHRTVKTSPKGQKRERRGRPKTYMGSTVSALERIWRVCDQICGKRLQPILPEMVRLLEKHGELVIDKETRNQLLTISASTIDRLLQRCRSESGRGKSTTKPGSLLKHQIAVRTFADWDDAVAGFVEIDLVAHCEDRIEGQFLYTLTATDIKTGWTACSVVARKSQEAVTGALEKIRHSLPFPLLGVDSDNGSEFINGTMLRYCQQHQITFTRCRPYKKNDQCFVEQKNWSIVRRTVGYGRYECVDADNLLQQLYADLRIYTNLYQPTFKLKSKKWDGAKLSKEYDTPQTPFQRILALPLESCHNRELWEQRYKETNPAALRRRIEANVKQLWKLRK